MTDTLISQLLDFGALGIFAGFLIWQHLGMQKRLDKLTGSFQAQLKEIDDGYERRVEIMRERCDDTIKEQRDKADEDQRLQTEMTLKVHAEVVTKLDAAVSKLDLGLNEMRIKYAEDRAKN
jgi:hypothetical protein